MTDPISTPLATPDDYSSLRMEWFETLQEKVLGEVIASYDRDIKPKVDKKRADLEADGTRNRRRWDELKRKEQKVTP